jgi:hypothetical protein
VQRGEDPVGYQRDPNHPIIDTNVDNGVRQISQQRTGLGTSATPDVEAAKG